MPKNIVICCDGTNNEITGHPTNVLRLFRMLVHHPGQQIVYYDGGVGTLDDPTAITKIRRVIRRKLDSAIGYSLRDNFCEAYCFLSHCHEPGDRIFLYGFSRGAYTVRALAGALHLIGLARREHDNLVRYAWSVYADEDNVLTTADRFEGAARFKKVFCSPVPIHMIGVFDTVSSLGWIWDYKTLPHTAVNPAIEHVRHAVAIDERRACFPANLFVGKQKNAPIDPDWKQVWFAGVHSDVGGGYVEQESGLAKVPLEWMIRESKALGLQVDPAIEDDMLGRNGNPKRCKSDPFGQMHESLTLGWWPLELVPRRFWKSGRKPNSGGISWHLPNLGRRRPMPDGAVLHKSVKDRLDNSAMSYKPPNLPKDWTSES